MALAHSEAASLDLLNLIISQGTRLVHRNSTIRKHGNNYVAGQVSSITDEMCHQAGLNSQGQDQTRHPDPQPLKIRRDILCCKSVPISPEKHSSRTSGGASDRKASDRRASDRGSTGRGSTGRGSTARGSIGRKSRGRTTQLTPTAPPPKQEKLLPLQQAAPDDGRVSTQYVSRLEQQIQNLRKQYLHLDSIARRQKELQEEVAAQKQAKIAQLKQKINSCVGGKDGNSVTYDIEGGVLCVEVRHRTEALRRRYPPSKTGYRYQAQPAADYEPTQTKGHLLASTTVKTMNLPKHSLNLSTRDAPVYQHEHARRNDIFNNNHSRQVTAVPYMQVAEGTHYTEANSKWQAIGGMGTVGKRRSQSQRTCRSGFKLHHYGDRMGQQAGQDNEEEQQPAALAEQRVTQSSRPYFRPRTGSPGHHPTHRITTTSDRVLLGELMP